MSRTREGEPTSLNPMRARFAAVVNHLIKELRVTHLIVVAHSQGSIIAVDELTHSWKKGELPSVSLVTLGSPVSELYQHYFPIVYPSWDHEQWRELFARLSRWGNFYRLDDYVGTRITPPRGLCNFHQRSVGCGGHTNYWRDPRFVDALNEWGLFLDADALVTTGPELRVEVARGAAAAMG